MTIAGLAGLLLWRRAILPTLWEKLVYGFEQHQFPLEVLDERAGITRH